MVLTWASYRVSRECLDIAIYQQPRTVLHRHAEAALFSGGRVQPPLSLAVHFTRGTENGFSPILFTAGILFLYLALILQP